MEDIIKRISRRYEGDIGLRPPFMGEAELDFPPELLDLLRESNGISETMLHPKTFEPIDIAWVLYPYEQILEGTALLLEDHGVEGWNFADDGADCLYLRKADGSISCYDQLERTETRAAGSLEEFYTG